MKYEKQKIMKELLSNIFDWQQSTSDVIVGIGDVVNQHVNQECLVIKNCPPAILYKVMDFVKAEEQGFLTAEMTDNGLVIS